MCAMMLGGDDDNNDFVQHDDDDDEEDGNGDGDDGDDIDDGDNDGDNDGIRPLCFIARPSIARAVGRSTGEDGAQVSVSVWCVYAHGARCAQPMLCKSSPVRAVKSVSLGFLDWGLLNFYTPGLFYTS